MFRDKRFLLAIPALAVLSLGTGCGGGSQQVTAAELVQKADQACREEQSKFREIQATPPANASDAADQTPLDGYLSARSGAIDEMKKGQDAADNQDSRAYGAAQAAVVKSAPQRRKLADSIGFKVCSSNANAV
jgi:hypothetical protein